MLALLVTALLPLVGGQQLQLQHELHHLRSVGSAQQRPPSPLPTHLTAVLPSVVAVGGGPATLATQFNGHAEELLELSPPPAPAPTAARPPPHIRRPTGSVEATLRPLDDTKRPRRPEETVTASLRRRTERPSTSGDWQTERPSTNDDWETERSFNDDDWETEHVSGSPPRQTDHVSGSTPRQTEHVSASPPRQTEHVSGSPPRQTDHVSADLQRNTETLDTADRRETEAWETAGRRETERHQPDSSLQLYSDAWDLGRTESPPAPADDSLSALEYELAAYNVTLFDAAMDFLLEDTERLAALLPNVSQWRGDDVNMTRSIAVMNALFTALQARLDDSDSLLERYGLPATDFNLRPVRRTWAQGAAAPQRRAQPVIHRFRPGVDERFLGSRSSCGSCEFSLMCWMSGGISRGGCGGFMFVCCDRGQRAAKSFNPPPRPIDYGPVRNDPGCGLSDTSRIGITRRIVGGNQAGFGTFPWQAYILIGTSRCGGSLINRQHVITAGHCVARARPGQITITLGDYVLNSNREPLPAYKFKVRAIQVHPRFQFTPQADRYDVAVLTLDRPVPYAPHIQPICLPEKGEEFEGYYGWAAGWGALRPGSRVRPKELQVVDVPVINRHMCEQWHRQKGINVIIHEEMMCAGYINGGKDSCQGDSGGPLMIENDGRWYLMGIVSAGYSCAQGKQPGIYHRVSMTSDWISYVAGN